MNTATANDHYLQSEELTEQANKLLELFQNNGDNNLLARAAEIFQQAYQICNANPRPLLSVALIYYWLKNYDKALVFLKGVLYIDPQSSEANVLFEAIAAKKSGKTVNKVSEPNMFSFEPSAKNSGIQTNYHLKTNASKFINKIKN